jgi:hypothetical protein
MGSNFCVRPSKSVVPLCLSLIDLLQAEVRGSPVYVANDEVDSMIQEASELLDPALRFDWLQWGGELLPRTEAAYRSQQEKRAAAERAEAERKAAISRQLKEAEAARTIKRQTSRSSRVGSADGARSPEQITKADSLKRGRGRRDTVTAEDVSAVAKGKSAAGKGKARPAVTPRVSLPCVFVSFL